MTDKSLIQLKRISGQIAGIIAMYEDGRSCVDVVRQAIAASNSLRTVARDLLTDEAGRCSRERNTAQLEAILKEVFKY